MSNELVRYGQKALVNSNEGGLRKETGAALAKTGIGVLAVSGLAALIPFVGPLFLAVVLFLVGGYLYLK